MLGGGAVKIKTQAKKHFCIAPIRVQHIGQRNAKIKGFVKSHSDRDRGEIREAIMLM